jgi:sigma-B regulation protein RsbU (phosphoserine phosphatase)
MERSHPRENPAIPAADDLVDRFVEELYHSTATLAQCSGTAIAFVERTTVQWLAVDERCTCCRQTVASPPCLAGERCAGRVSEPLNVSYEGSSLGTVIVCCEQEQQPLLEAVRQLVQAALRHVELDRDNESLVEELGASWESLEAVYEISFDMRLLQDPTHLLNRITAKAVASQGGLHAVLWRADAGELVPMSTQTTAAIQTRPREEGLIGRVLEQRRAIMLNGRRRIAAEVNLEPELRQAISVAVIPVATSQGVLGALEVWQEKGATAFDSRTLRLLETLALQAAMVMENDRLHRESIERERLRQEIQIGSKIQQMLLRAEPPDDLIDVSIAAMTIPSQRIDGDFYEFVRHHDRCLDVMIGNVMGKGLPAALLGAATKSHFFRVINRLRSGSAPPKLPEPAEIVTAVSAAMTRQLLQIESFLTLCYARLDFEKHRLDFVDCGHSRIMLLRRRTGICEYLQGKNLPLGVIEGETYQQMATSFEDGDVLLFHSDSVAETHEASGSTCKEEYLAELVRRHGHLHPSEMLAAIRTGVITSAQSGAFEDDFTCVAVKLGPPTTPPLRAEAVKELTSDHTEL